jgi:hypothetical protein
MEFLKEYELEIKHIKEKEKKVVDVPNRREHEMHIVSISVY